MKQMKGLKHQGGWVQYAAAGTLAITSIGGARSGAKKAKRLGAENVALIGLETEETLRRMEKTQAQLEGEATARVAASGFTGKGSVEKYFEELETEYKSQVDWTKRVGEQRKKVAAAGGSAAASQIKTAGITGAIGAGAMAAGWYES